ncbi:MAG: cytochrome c3 family protein [bacterium]
MRSRPAIFLLVCLLAAIGISSESLAVDGGANDKRGAHNQKVVGIRDPVCTYCHFSTSGKGEKIWEDLPLGAQTLPSERGVKVVCSSCHYPGNAVNARSGFTLGQHEPGGHDFSQGNALVDTSLLGIGESHVMSMQAEPDPAAGKLRTALDTSSFPLRDADIEDEANLPEGYPKDSGFTCTTCHDPHNQPNQDISGNGDYLRTKKEKLAGQSDQRTALCIQCHEDTAEARQHGASAGCNQCHHPHDGYYQLSSRRAQLGRSILTKRILPVDFQAPPNVVAFGPQEEERDGTIGPDQGAEDQDESSLCYSCHGPSASRAMRDAGAKPLFGLHGDASFVRGHHPMGSKAQLGKAHRAPGLENADLNRYGQVTCTSCHDGFHRGKNLNFLKEDFSNDSAALCTGCHTDKTARDLGTAGSAHRQVCGESPNKRGECMFCHFIHDGPDRGPDQTPANRALLRVDPVNLAWSDQAGDADTDDFEDMCFGCHSSSRYMKGTGKDGARLHPQEYFSHRFASLPSTRVHPTLPVSDGNLDGVVDDYGVEKGKIYCGSCHDIHHSANAPYLRGGDSPYAGGGFCARCHTEYPANGRSSHPLGVSPRPGITAEEFPPFAYGGKSGVPRGVTSDESPGGQVLCLTCHSIHAAKTSFDGRIDLAQSADESSSGSHADTESAHRHGKLLVVDNFSSDKGSDLCLSCHPSHQGIVGSRHDFTDMKLGAPLSFGTCSACHIPHGSSEKTMLWTRSLTEERKTFSQAQKPNYQRGVTLLCYDCHDDHNAADDDPPLSSFLHSPPDIAYSDGPGQTSTVGYYETIPPGSYGEDGVDNPPTNGMETGGHYIKTAGLTEMSNGIGTGDKLSCDLCHDPHRTSNNEVFLRNPLGNNKFAGLKASGRTKNGTGTGREICVSCHGYSESNMPINTPVEFFGIEIVKPPDRARDNSSVYTHHSKNDRKTPCTKCHVHNSISTKPESERSGPDTHGVHFASLFSQGEKSIVVRQAVQTEESTDRSCDICHSPELTFKAGKLIFRDGKSLEETAVCDTCHSRGGKYDGANGYYTTVSDFDYGAKDSWRFGVYEEVIDNNGRSDWQLRPYKEAWCLNCHDDQPSRIQNPELDEQQWVQAPNILGDPDGNYGFEKSGHGLATSDNYTQSGRTGAGLNCPDCHSPMSRHIVNSQRERKVNYKNWQDNKYRLKLDLKLPRRGVEYQNSDFELCFSCHEEASIIGLPPGYTDYTDNHNPYVNLNMDTYPMTHYSNANVQGLYPIKKMGQSIQIDFSRIFPTSSYNLHWNHLSLPDAVIDPNAIIRPQSQNSSSSGNQRTQTCLSNRCHGRGNVVKEGDTDFWDSDRDGKLDSRPSCTACHNPHGSGYVSMTRDDLAITHGMNPGGEEFGKIGSGKYGAYDDSLDNYNDLYCWECHAKLQRTGDNYRYYYPQSLIKDLMAPEPPR